MSENYKIQANFKTSDRMDAVLVNVRADNPGELQSMLDWIVTNGATFIGDAEKAIKGITVVNAAFPGSTVESTQQAPQQSWGNDQGGFQNPPPAFAPQQQAAPAAPQGPAPSCVHGQMQYRSGQGKNGPWQAYFCPTPKGTPNQCQAQFIRNR